MKALYIKTISDFLDDIEENSYVSEMTDAARNSGFCPSDSEKKSWEQNGIAIKELLDVAQLPKDVLIGFEYLVPVGGRIDCVILGLDKKGVANMLHIELKQWSNDNVSPFYRTDAHSFRLDVAVDGYRDGSHIVSHPAEQAREYQNHLCHYLSVFTNGDVNLYGCAYCYNYESKNDNCALLDEFYQNTVLQRCKLYCCDQKEEFSKELGILFAGGNGHGVFEKINNCECKPTERLQDVAKSMFDGKNAQEIFSLVGGQLDAYNTILGAIENTDKNNEKTVVIVKGGPGTGKSVIALRLISGLAKTGKYRDIYYSTRSSSLRNGLKELLNGVHYLDNQDNSAEGLICNNIDFRPYGKSQSSIDALIVDEAHRIGDKANDQTDRSKEMQTHLSQIMAMLYTARVSVFFIDDRQSIEGKEIGTSEQIREAAENYYNRIMEETEKYKNVTYLKLPKKIESAEKTLKNALESGDKEKIRKAQNALNSCRGEYDYGLKWIDDINDVTDVKVNVIELELTDQFRCNGSNNYINWVDKVLYKSDNNQHDADEIILDTEKYEFEVFDTPQKLYEKIRSLDGYAQDADLYIKNQGDLFSYKELYEYTKEKSYTQSARMAAGYCWTWVGKALQNGDLPHDVSIPEYDFDMPWETKAKPQYDYKYKYAKDADTWCNQHEGVNQIGCVYSLQGWETDYIGVIIGPDLKYDKENDCLKSDNTVKTHGVSKDPKQHNRLVKNIYRVLLTRGKKGCFIFSCDPEVGKYFKRNIGKK